MASLTPVSWGNLFLAWLMGRRLRLEMIIAFRIKRRIETDQVARPLPNVLLQRLRIPVVVELIHLKAKL